jgi:C1A family cysteine protease
MLKKKILVFLIICLFIGLNVGSSISESLGKFTNTNSSKDFQTTIFKIEKLPDYFNWKDYNGEDWTTPAKTQYEHSYCGSCWAFAPIGALESVIKIREGYADFNPDLSEQYVISCLEAGNKKGYGCRGATFPSSMRVFKCIMETTSAGNNCNGVVLESCFPYSSRLFHYVPCSDKCDDWNEFLVPISDWGCKILKGVDGEQDWIKKTIMEKGPVVADIIIPLFFYSPLVPWFLPLHSWGYDNHDPSAYFPSGRSYIGLIGHVLVIVGWKDDASISNGGYWICKNSWGVKWGYDGFANIEYGSMTIDRPTVTSSAHIGWVDYDPDSFEWPHEI